MALQLVILTYAFGTTRVPNAPHVGKESGRALTLGVRGKRTIIEGADCWGKNFPQENETETAVQTKGKSAGPFEYSAAVAFPKWRDDSKSLRKAAPNELQFRSFSTDGLVENEM